MRSGGYTLPCTIRRRSASGVMSTSSIWSARRAISSGRVSCCTTPVIRLVTSLSDSRCWMFSVVTTLMSASSSSSTSCHRLPFRQPGTFVGQLVHQRDLRAAGKDRVQVHLAEVRPAVAHHPPRHRLQALGQRRGQLPAVRFHQRGHHVRAARPAALALRQHRVRLPHAGRRAQVHAQRPSRRRRGVRGHGSTAAQPRRACPR